jgi:cell division protein FtsA
LFSIKSFIGTYAGLINALKYFGYDDDVIIKEFWSYFDKSINDYILVSKNIQENVNDLAIGLKTDLDIAEKVKIEHADLSKPVRSTVSVMIDKVQHTFSADEVHMVIEARIEELFELIDKELKRIGKSRKLPGGVVFTGGSSNIKGLVAFAKENLELPAKIGKLTDMGGLNDLAEDLSFTTPVGLMLLDMLLDGQHATGHPNNYPGMMDNISSLFKRFKKR